MCIEIIIGLLLNTLLGVIVLSKIDDEKQSLYKWYLSADDRFGVLGTLIQVLVLNCWLIILWYKVREVEKQ